MPSNQKAKTRGDKVFSEAERAAVAATARERKAASGRSPAEERAEGLKDLRDSIGKMPADDRAMAERIHTIVSDAAPGLVPKTYYGMPAYATEGKNGKVICFFQSPSKFKVRYATLGFQPDAKVDEGEMWPIAFAVTKLTPAVEKRIADLVKKAIG